MNYKKILLIFLVLALQFVLVVQFGTSAYMRGYKDGELIKGRQLAAMIYLKPKIPVESKMAVDAWELIEDAKSEKPDDLEFHNMYLSGVREMMLSGYENYTPAFQNGIKPKDGFIIKK